MILVTDANILITLFDVDGVAILPQIAPTEILDVVLDECEHVSQPGLRAAVMAAGVGIVPADMAWALEARKLMNGRLSFQDALSLYYAKTQGRVLLSGDRPLRNRSAAEGVDCRGAIWIVRQAFEKGLLPNDVLCRWIAAWAYFKRRLPTEEVRNLEVDLGCAEGEVV